ncbi:MAG: hypothetical protein K2F59_04090, partial [Eubacteriales bacterium]|nr:hypothetical protein [Eubacteriales bacterium]
SRNRISEPTKRLNSRYEANIREERIKRNNNTNTSNRNKTRTSNRNKTRTSTKAKKQRNNIKIARVFTFFIFFLIISYFGFSIYKSLTKKPITYETINYGTIDNQKIAKGVIIRDETVYKAGRDGSLGFYKSGNERIKKGEIVASIKDETALQNTEQELEEINKRILEIQENREELSLFSEDVKKVDLQIQYILENNVYEFAENDMSSIYKIKDNVQKKLDIRNQMLLSETGGSISELANQRSAKEQIINSNTENISIKESGILSYYVDGLEEAFNIDNLDSITKEQTKMQAEKQDELLNYKIQVLQGDAVFKIVESNEFYIASYIKTEYLNNWNEGDLK